jgi:hypothetical protein
MHNNTIVSKLHYKGSPISKGMLGVKGLSSEKFDGACQMPHVFQSRKNAIFVRKRTNFLTCAQREETCRIKMRIR